jgi:hypothetical protein
MLPSHDRSMGIFAATPIAVGGERLLGWGRRVEQLQRGPYVSAIRRFSEPPRLEDLAELTLDEEDLADIAKCRPGDCGVKLSHEEMKRLHRAIAGAGGNWRSAVEEEFRRVVLARVTGYLQQGHATSAYHDKKTVVSLQTAFAELAQSFGNLNIGGAELLDYLKGYPQSAAPHLESFMYWSRETLGARPIISVTHAFVRRGDGPGQPEALIASKRVFATHYVTASLGLTAIMPATSASTRYLVYVNRTAVDFVDGFFGSIIRPIVHRRVRAEAPSMLLALRRRLEAGEPVQ